MGSNIELNDTLVLTELQGFPENFLSLERRKNLIGPSVLLEDIADREFEFKRDGVRHYHQAPTRCFLVHNTSGKWLYWGHILITEQTIRNGDTSGKFVITKIYDPEYQRLATINESPEGKSYF